MALHINLYHEVQKQQRARRRDPLKLGMVGLACVGVGFLVYYFFRMERVHELNVHVAVLQADWARLEPKEKEAKAREDELNVEVKLADSFVKRIEGRFYWAPILAQIVEKVPQDVQLTKLSGNFSSDKTGVLGLTVNGISSSATPRKAAEDLRTALGEKLGENFKKVTSHFNTLDDSEESVTVGAKKCPTALFAIEYQLTKAESEAASGTAPVRIKKVAVQ